MSSTGNGLIVIPGLMSAIGKRIPLILALLVAVYVFFSVSIGIDPKLPFADGWLSQADTRSAVKWIVAIVVFAVILLVSSVAVRYIERGSPNRFKAPLFELDWAPEGTSDLRQIYEILQKDQREAADLIKEMAGRINALERQVGKGRKR